MPSGNVTWKSNTISNMMTGLPFPGETNDEER